MNEPGNNLQALVGHALDLTRLARMEVQNPYSYSKFRQIKAVARRTGARILLETGTFKGVTARRCAPHFEKVFTIELDAALAARSRDWLASCRNVSLIEGDANTEALRVLDEEAVSDVLVFLDGHFSGGETAHGNEAEPAVRILEALAKRTDRIAAVIIDDFREFGSAPGWPTKWQLVRSSEELFVPLGYKLRIHMDQLLLERQ